MLLQGAAVRLFFTKAFRAKLKHLSDQKISLWTVDPCDQNKIVINESLVCETFGIQLSLVKTNEFVLTVHKPMFSSVCHVNISAYFDSNWALWIALAYIGTQYNHTFLPKRLTMTSVKSYGKVQWTSCKRSPDYGSLYKLAAELCVPLAWVLLKHKQAKSPCVEEFKNTLIHEVLGSLVLPFNVKEYAWRRLRQFQEDYDYFFASSKTGLSSPPDDDMWGDALNSAVKVGLAPFNIF